MSGGSYNYAYRHVEDMALALSRKKSPLHNAFGRHLLLVAKAMHDIEWVDSGDYGEGREFKAIEIALGEHWREPTIAEALDQIDTIKEELIALLEDGKDVQNKDTQSVANTKRPRKHMDGNI